MRTATSSAARQRPRPDSEIAFDGEISWRPLQPSGKDSISQLTADRRNAAFRSGRCPLMGWSGRAPAPASKRSWPGGTKVKEHAMSQKLNSAIAVIGIDIGKNSFHVVGHDRRGAIVLRQKWSRTGGDTA